MSKKTDAIAGTVPDDRNGVGGSYSVDPDTGERTLIERTAPVGEMNNESEAENGASQA